MSAQERLEQVAVPAINADSAALAIRAQCQVKNSGAQAPVEVQEFALTLTSQAAKIELSENGHGGIFIGHLKPKPAGRADIARHVIMYSGFEDLLPDYEVSLGVPSSAFLSSRFEVTLYGRGDALLSEDYVCVLN